MVTVLQAVELAEKCFLSEVLLWLAVKRLPLAQYNIDGDESHFSDENELDLSKEPIVSIRQNEWTARKIDWKSSALFGDEYTFCWIHFSTESVLAAYPIPSLPPVGTVNSLGDVYILNNSDNRDLTTSIRRGRPSLPWELFHLEVASLARANALPEKKEAAIHHFESWFREELGLHVGRSSIGQKLTPYYDRFVRAQPKIGGY